MFLNGTLRVYRTPRTDGVGVGNPAGTLMAVDALNGARTVFQSEEDRAVLVREEELEDPVLEPERDRSETMLDVQEEETGSPTGEVVDDFAVVSQLPSIRKRLLKCRPMMFPFKKTIKPTKLAFWIFLQALPSILRKLPTTTVMFFLQMISRRSLMGPRLG